MIKTTSSRGFERAALAGCEDRRFRTAISRVGATFAIGLVVVACGGPSNKARSPSETCPDLSKVDDVVALDFAREYGVSVAEGDKLKAAMMTATELGAFSDRLDADLGLVCAQIAHDLGDKGDWRSGADACAAAHTSLRDVRAKAGPKVQMRLVVQPSVCLVDTSLVTKCASLCDSSVSATRGRAECERDAGRCDGSCDGSCEPKNRMKCDGVCGGSCEGTMKGTCGGRCVGTCDGRRVSGGCLGVCVGTCDHGAMNGECKGTCAGTCNFGKPGICDGVCAGTCSVELSEVRCAGGFKVPDVSSDCRVRCDLATMSETSCSTPRTGVVIVGAKERELVESMKATVETSFPALLRILAEVGETGANRVQSAGALVEDTRKRLDAIARSGQKDDAAAIGAQLVKCFDEPLKKAGVEAQVLAKSIEQAVALRNEVAR